MLIVILVTPKKLQQRLNTFPRLPYLSRPSPLHPLSRLQEQLPDAPAVKPEDLGSPQTLGAADAPTLEAIKDAVDPQRLVNPKSLGLD